MFWIQSFYELKNLAGEKKVRLQGNSMYFTVLGVFYM